MSDASYVGAYFDWDTDRVVVWERQSATTPRTRLEFPAQHYLYLPHENGPFTSIFGEKLYRVDCDSRAELKEIQRREGYRCHESDIQPLFKELMSRYYGRPTPVVNFALLDIEVDYTSKLGFAGPSNPYGIINAVTIYQSWTKKYKQYAVPPVVDGVQWNGTVEDVLAEFHRLAAEKHLDRGVLPELVLVRTEAELLQHLIADIQEADIISGWNSEFYDLPYIVKRLQLVWPRLVHKLCFIGCPPPKERQVERFGSPEIVYALHGRTHLDYRDLFEKFTFEGRESYALGNILAEEIGRGKLAYSGTLEELYKNDFPTFCAYNFRDVSGLVDLDAKFKFIQLVNQMAHENTCLFQNILGTVRYVETGITNFAHNVLNLIVPDKRVMTDGEKVEGALVLSPNIGLHEWIGAIDIKSLYPNVIRSLNMSPETYRGQFTGYELDWEGVMRGDHLQHVLADDHGESLSMTGREWKQLLDEQRWVVTAYGTVFDQSQGEGLLPRTLAFWFAERIELQLQQEKWANEGKRLRESTGIKLQDESVDHGLIQDGEKLYTAQEWEAIEEADRQEEHYDLLQLTKKIQLNSTYGALLNEAFKFGRKEIGASTTACGRQITTFMMGAIHQLVRPGTSTTIEKTTQVDSDGKVEHIYRTDSDVILYGDTDSCYFLTHESTLSGAAKVADAAAAGVNRGFTMFMREAFGCQPGFDTLIRGSREVVAVRGLFQAKKKYVLNVVDKDGKPVGQAKQLSSEQVLLPNGLYSLTGDLKQVKLKSQGSELKKADTPKVIQLFLQQLMYKLLGGAEYPEVEAFVNQQRRLLLGKTGNIFAVGVAKQANNLDAFHAAWIRAGKPTAGKIQLAGAGQAQAVPGHIRAAIHYNELAEQYETGAKRVRSGDKVRIFYLKKNMHGMKSIGFPAELDKFPAWFEEEFQVDRALTESKMFDNKLEGVFAAIGWEVPTPQNTLINSILKF